MADAARAPGSRGGGCRSGLLVQEWQILQEHQGLEGLGGGAGQGLLVQEWQRQQEHQGLGGCTTVCNSSK